MMADTSCYVVGEIPLVKYEGTMKQCIGNEDVEYAAFLGIPYAVIPKGLKRYQAPETLIEIDSELMEESTLYNLIPTYKANKVGKICTQIFAAQKTGSSDCLYMNIFMPKKPEDIDPNDPLYPVLVFIHGGSFACESNDSERYSPDSIVQHGLVFVTINYRLGLFGFFNMRSPLGPGNMGLKDQVKALEWIRNNISCFSGDPENVTLSGWNTGGTCVNLHLISPMSQELFHKAIVQSGGIYTLWGYKGHRREQKRLFFNDANLTSMLFAEHESEDLQTYAAHLLIADHEDRHPSALAPYFGPSVEKYQEGAFIKEPIEITMQKVDHINKPVMAGITKGEGILQYVIDANKNYPSIIDDHHQFCQFLKDNLRWSAETAEEFADRIRDQYFPQRQTLSLEEKDRCFANLLTDIFFRRFYDNFKFGSEKKVHENLYIYRFDHKSEISAVSSHPKLFQFQDATHGDDLLYLFCPYKVSQFMYKHLSQSSRTEILEVTNHMCSLWANFCKTGIPKSDFAEDVVWTRHTQEEPCYLSISKDLTLMKEYLYQERWGWFHSNVDSVPTVESLATTPEE